MVNTIEGLGKVQVHNVSLKLFYPEQPDVVEKRQQFGISWSAPDKTMLCALQYRCEMSVKAFKHTPLQDLGQYAQQRYGSVVIYKFFAAFLTYWHHVSKFSLWGNQAKAEWLVKKVAQWACKLVSTFFKDLCGNTVRSKSFVYIQVFFSKPASSAAVTLISANIVVVVQLFTPVFKSITD